MAETPEQDTAVKLRAEILRNALGKAREDVAAADPFYLGTEPSRLCVFEVAAILAEFDRLRAAIGALPPNVDRPLLRLRQSPTMPATNFRYRMWWSDEDREYVITCAEFPGLSGVARRPGEALHELWHAIAAAIAAFKADGEPAAVASTSEPPTDA